MHEPIERFVAAVRLLRRLAQVGERAFGSLERLRMAHARVVRRVHRAVASRSAEEREDVHAPPVRGTNAARPVLLRALPSLVLVVQQVRVRDSREARASRELVLPSFEQALARVEQRVAPHVRGDERAQAIAQLVHPLLLLPGRRQRLRWGDAGKGRAGVSAEIEKSRDGPRNLARVGRTAMSGVSDAIPASNCSRNASTATATSPMSLPRRSRCGVGRRPLSRALTCAPTRARRRKVKPRCLPPLPVVAASRFGVRWRRVCGQPRA